MNFGRPQAAAFGASAGAMAGAFACAIAPDTISALTAGDIMRFLSIVASKKV